MYGKMESFVIESAVSVDWCRVVVIGSAHASTSVFAAEKTVSVLLRCLSIDSSDVGATQNAPDRAWSTRPHLAAARESI